jgi:hypothetical protein
MGDGKNGLDWSAVVDSLSEVEFANLYVAADRRLRTEAGVKKGMPLDAVCVDARKLSPDTYAVLAWANGSEKLPPGFPSPGCNAAVQFLEALNDLRGNAIAAMLRDPGSSEMQLKLGKRTAGRPRNYARDALEKLKLGMNAESKIAAQTLAGLKPKKDAETQATVDETGKSRSTVYDARATLRRAKALRHNSPN